MIRMTAPLATLSLTCLFSGSSADVARVDARR
jgi:hypothetical protein